MTDPLAAFYRERLDEAASSGSEVIPGDIKAKREILAAHEDALKTLRTAEGHPGTVLDLMTGAVNSYRNVIRLLAEPYADQPGYLEEWRP